MMLAISLASCGRAPEPGRARDVSVEVPVSVLADSGEGGGLPPARFARTGSVARSALVRIAPDRDGIRAPLPEPEPSVPPADSRADAPVEDDRLRPPIPRGPLALRLPRARPGRVELDVRVDEHGEVTEVVPVAGDADAATIAAAVEAARRVRWYPATRRGQPVAVWCRQHVDTGPER